ncbi:hypothetical protein VNO77_39059 [Canavalia gladiata]|uniref:Uncharacterized protein n=1 Tax=Canavalia gladiata TaxID=3824 RepID=A0AAN9KAD7_CANGL
MAMAHNSSALSQHRCTCCKSSSMQGHGIQGPTVHYNYCFVGLPGEVNDLGVGGSRSMESWMDQCEIMEQIYCGVFEAVILMHHKPLVPVQLPT